MENIIIYAQGLVSMSICVKSELTKEQIEKQVNILSPTGISSKWSISKDKTFQDGSPNPCDCNEHKGKRKHYLLNC